MAYTFSSSSSSSNSNTEVFTCSKACLKSYETLKEYYDNLTKDFNKSQFNLGAYKAGLEYVEARLEVYKNNETVFEDEIKILKIDVMFRDKAITELRQKFKKAKKERDDLKLTLEKFEGSSKNLSRLIDSQQSDKSKTSLGYDSQGFDSQVLENQVNDKYNSGEGYHALLPSYTTNYMPPKPDLVFADEHVVSKFITSLPGIAKSKVTTSETKLKNVSALIIEDWVSDSEDENEIKTETKQIKPSFAKVKFVKPIEHVKSLRKSVKQEENNRQTQYPRKTSQSPKGNVIDHISKDSGSYMLKRFNYVDLQDYQEIDGGFVMHLEFKLVVEQRLVLNRCLDWIVTAAKNEIQKPTESDGFEQIVDFLNANPIKYALTVNPTIYTSCIQQFWDSTKVKIVNEDVHKRALINGKKIIVNEASIRHDLKLQDAEGKSFSEIITPLFETMMVQAPKEVGEGLKRKETKIPHIEPQTKESVPTPSNDPLPGGEDRMQLTKLINLCTKLSDMVLSLGQINTNQVAEIEKLKKRVKKLEGKKNKRTHWLKRMYKVGLSVRIVSSNEEGLGDQEDASKQGRIVEIDADEDLSLINETAQDQGRMNEEDLFRVNDLDGDEVIVDVTAGKNVEQDATVVEKEVSTADDEVVTTTEDVEGTTAATTPKISKDDVTLAQTLIEIKAAKPKARGVIVQEPSEFKTTPSSQPSQLLQAKDKEVARNLEVKMKAKMKEEERIAREKDEANIAVIEECDDVQAIIDADKQLAEQVQAQEREQLSIEERSKLLAELIKSRRKYFAAKKAEEIKNKPPTKAQQKSLMCTYMKIIEGYKQKDFKGKRFDVIKKMFDKVYKRVNTFVDMNTKIVEESLNKTQAEVTEGSSKRAEDEIEQESAKRQRLEKEDDTAELKRCLEIVSEDDYDVTIEATPISSKSPTIVDYKIYKEGKKSYFIIIRAD
nr:hypothetical protein [Tanacetum cinerariifolium]